MTAEICPQNGGSNSCTQPWVDGAYRTWLGNVVDGAVRKVLQLLGDKHISSTAAERRMIARCSEVRRCVTAKIHALLLQWSCTSHHRPSVQRHPRHYRQQLPKKQSLPPAENAEDHLSEQRDPHHYHQQQQQEQQPPSPAEYCGGNEDGHPHRQSEEPSFHLHHGLHSARWRSSLTQALPLLEEAFYQQAPSTEDYTNPLLLESQLRRVLCLFEAGQGLALLQKSTVLLPHDPSHHILQTATTSSPSSLYTELWREASIDKQYFEWERKNLRCSGTVASLMASESRSSRKDEANRALCNAIARGKKSWVERDLRAHGEFASDRIVRRAIQMVGASNGPLTLPTPPDHLVIPHQRLRRPLISFLAFSSPQQEASQTSPSHARRDACEEHLEPLDPYCCVCMVAFKGAALVPCGHTYCRKCSRELHQGQGSCPLCNGSITSILNIY